MESTVIYITIIIIVILVITVYNYRKKQVRYYLLSLQRYPELTLSISIQKQKGKISAVFIKLSAIKEVELKDLKIELITAKREFNNYSLQSLLESNPFPVKLEENTKTKFLVRFEDFRTLLMDGEHPFRTFRFVVVSDKGQTYKSHEMGFDKKWVIYRPDSGKYN
ncbi:MAG TPA: hypothetical protein QF480_09005 [Bacteroidales bacterium]|jgi:hypothetical protein|nr:hypothetical protein [Bacteroidota bacterium]HJN06739.1 hypothetical protein [Bacteroidales bacterium]|tara:strand:- start:191 stop:685 length:495 start_codon:yes stop_codon:yes gene_type:complete